jgi:hypothetical protein
MEGDRHIFLLGERGKLDHIFADPHFFPIRNHTYPAYTAF